MIEVGSQGVKDGNCLKQKFQDKKIHHIDINTFKTWGTNTQKGQDGQCNQILIYVNSHVRFFSLMISLPASHSLATHYTAPRV